jgi:hypothetical protein
VLEQDIPERPFGSTTFGWRYVKLASPAGGHQAVRSSAKGFRRLPRWPMRKPLPLTIKYRGGAEGWVEIHSRGNILRVPGSTSIYDVLARITNNSQ